MELVDELVADRPRQAAGSRSVRATRVTSATGMRSGSVVPFGQKWTSAGVRFATKPSEALPSSSVERDVAAVVERGAQRGAARGGVEAAARVRDAILRRAGRAAGCPGAASPARFGPKSAARARSRRSRAASEAVLDRARLVAAVHHAVRALAGCRSRGRSRPTSVASISSCERLGVAVLRAGSRASASRRCCSVGIAPRRALVARALPMQELEEQRRLVEAPALARGCAKILRKSSRRALAPRKCFWSGALS